MKSLITMCLFSLMSLIACKSETVEETDISTSEEVVVDSTAILEEPIEVVADTTAL